MHPLKSLVELTGKGGTHSSRDPGEATCPGEVQALPWLSAEEEN